MALKNSLVLSDSSNSGVLCFAREQVEDGHNATLISQQISHYEYGAESIPPWSETIVSNIPPPMDTTTGAAVTNPGKQVTKMSEYAAKFRIRQNRVTNPEDVDDEESLDDDLISPIDLDSTGDATSWRANKSRDPDPLYDPSQDGEGQDEDDQFSLRIPKDGRRKRALDPTYTPGKYDEGADEDDQFSLRIPKDGRRKRALDPTYTPGKYDEGADEDDQFSLRIPKDGRRKRALDPTYTPGKDDGGEFDDEQLPTGSLRKKRRTLDPAFVPDKDDDGDHDKFLDSSKRGKGRTTDKPTSKRKATADIGVGNLPTPSKDTPSRATKRKKTEPASPPRAPFSPALTDPDPQPDNSDGDGVVKHPWELVNARTQPDHPLVLNAMKVLNKIADDRNKAFFALVKAHQRSRKSYPASLADITNDQANTQGREDSSGKRSKSCDPVVRHTDSAAPADDPPAIQEDEANESVPDLTLERAKRWANAVNVPKDLWSEVEEQLFRRIAMRGFEPLLPKQWHYDFSTLPNPLFADSGEKPAPLINAIRGSEFYAIRSLSVLFSLGGYVRDCSLLHRRPEPIIKRAISKYIRWAVYDAGLHVSSEAIPVHAIYARKRGESTVNAVVKVNRRLQKLADRFRSAYGLASATKELVAPANRATRESATGSRATPPNSPPLLTGFVISGPVVAILTLNTDPSAAKGQRGTEDSNFICQFDLSEQGQDVWNSLGVAISVMHIRNTMMELAEHNLAGLCRFNVDAHVALDQDL